MIIIQIAGGLGNQMQQYALYRSFLAKGRNAKLDLSWFEPEVQKNVRAKREPELTWFRDLPMEICTPAEAASLRNRTTYLSRALRKVGVLKSHEYAEDLDRMYCEEIFDLTDAYVTGYYACNKYYEAVLPELKSLFEFPDAKNEAAGKKNLHFTEQLAAEEKSGVIPVSLHFRRGDYLDQDNNAVLGGICTPAYYEGAVRYLKDLFTKGGTDPRGKYITPAAGAGTPEFHFYLFSDDPDYARTLHFGGEGDLCTVIDWNTGRDSMLDMKLMSLCRANICANSSFSIWGGRLNAREDAITIRPSVHRNTLKTTSEEMHRCWTGWALVTPGGEVV